MNKKEVCLVKLPSEKLCLIPMEEILEQGSNYSELKPCKIISQEKNLGFWIYEKTNEGCSMYDYGLSDEVIVRDITEKDVDEILKNGGKCFVEVDYKNELSIPRNGHGHGKIVIFLS